MCRKKRASRVVTLPWFLTFLVARAPFTTKPAKDLARSAAAPFFAVKRSFFFR
jgi:hypothetical protein